MAPKKYARSRPRAEVNDSDDDYSTLTPSVSSTPTWRIVGSPLRTPDDINVLVGSWNVATRTPTPEAAQELDILPWIGAPLLDEGGSLLDLNGNADAAEFADTTDATASRPAIVPPDIVVLGFQELVTQTAATMLPRVRFFHGAARIIVKKEEGELGGLEPWLDLASEALERAYGGGGTRGDFADNQEFEDDTMEDEDQVIRYEPLCVKRMVALGLMVFVREGPGARVKIRGIRAGSVGTGLLGLYGNKGSVAVGLDVDLCEDYDADDETTPRPSTSRPVSLCFINSHLGPHEGESYWAWRNEEVCSIFDTLVLTPRSGTDVGHGPGSTPRWAMDHDVIWFFGDLNYRMRGAGSWSRPVRNISREHVLDRIDLGDVATLLDLDELSHNRRSRRDFLRGFLEPPIGFLPTYKYDIEERGGDDLKGDATTGPTTFSRKRCPAYCDRILYRAVDASSETAVHDPDTKPLSHSKSKRNSQLLEDAGEEDGDEA
ncbi:hypothetical protein HK104_007817, partial [Borealophlyctis nickersoniae]